MDNNYRTRTDYIVVHSTKTKSNQDLNAKDITLLHRKEGFFHNAFHFIIKRDGTIEEVRPEDMSGAILPINQPLITNQNSIAIALVGGLADDGKRVIIAGLDMDFLGNPFGVMPQILAVAEHVTKVHAICIDCGSIANHSFRLTKSKALVEIGEKEEYKPLCRNCF